MKYLVRTWSDHISRVNDFLVGVKFTNLRRRAIPADNAFDSWRRLTLAIRRANGSVFMIGNGASASMASHVAADLAKNAGLHTEVFSDLSLITAISNDMGYEHVFAEPLRRRGQAGDMLVAISSSGRSPNVLNAMRTARKLRMTVVTLSAMHADNPLRAGGDLNAYVPASTYGDAESCHATVLHYWLDLVMAEPQAARRPSKDHTRRAC